MAYKIIYNDCLMHFNGNHSSKNGQFTSGDGDKDGVVDDHHNYARNKNKGMKGTGTATPVAKNYKYTNAKNPITKNNGTFAKGRAQLNKGIKQGVVGTILEGAALNLNSSADSLEGKKKYIVKGAALVAGLSGTALQVSGIVNSAKGGMAMRKGVMDRKAKLGSQ